MEITTEFGGLDVRSVAGRATRVLAPGYKAVFDLGETGEAVLRTQIAFISHTHTDHISAIWQHAAVRGLVGNQVGTYVVPEVMAERVRWLMEAAERCDCAQIPYSIVPMKAGDELIYRNKIVKSFETYHRVPAMGYAVINRVPKLKAEFKGKSHTELAQLSNAGVLLTEDVDTVEFAYTGDTRIRVLSQELVRKAKTLCMECTFVGPDLTPAHASETGHIHIDEIAAHADEFENEHIVLMHFSARYSAAEVHAEAKKKLPAHLFERVTLVTDQLK